MIKLKVLSLLIVIITTLSFTAKIYARDIFEDISEQITDRLQTIAHFNRNTSPKNIINSSRIRWSGGWKKSKTGNIWSEKVTYQSVLGGSEFSFKFSSGESIKFQLETSKTEPIIGLEVWLDNKYFNFAYPNIKPEQTIIEISDQGKNKIHELRGRVYCFSVPAASCDMHIKSIVVDGSVKLLNQGKEIKKTLAILGDSISGIHGNNSYSYLLADKINYFLLNASYNGSTMSEDGGTYPGVVRIKTEIIPYKPDLLIIFLGTNDLGHKLKLENMVDDYEYAVALLKKELPRTTIISLGILTRIDYSHEEINAYSELIKKIAEKNGLYYVDTYDWLGNSDLSDGIHPSLSAQVKIEERIYDYLKDNNLLYQKIK